VTTIHNSRHPGGRPPGIIRRNNIKHGVYSTDLGDVLTTWRQKNRANAARVDEIIASILHHLHWEEANNSRYIEVRDVAVLCVARDVFMYKILSMEFSRRIRDPDTGVEIEKKPCDQLRRLYELDDDITHRMFRLGLLPEGAGFKGLPEDAPKYSNKSHSNINKKKEI
jgi:hypothetical protein